MSDLSNNVLHSSDSITKDSFVNTRPPNKMFFPPFHLIIPILIIDSHGLILSVTQGHLFISFGIDLVLMLRYQRLVLYQSQISGIDPIPSVSW